MRRETLVRHHSSGLLGCLVNDVRAASTNQLPVNTRRRLFQLFSLTSIDDVKHQSTFVCVTVHKTVAVKQNGYKLSARINIVDVRHLTN